MYPTLTHYSRHPFRGPVQSVRQPAMPGMKPEGLWLCADEADGWKAWCEAEEFSLDTLAHASRVELAPAARILVLSGLDDISAFTHEHGVDTLGMASRGHVYMNAVNWARVAADYQGILIAPYVWEARLNPETNWYYTWDVASACIWDAAAIGSIVPLEVPA